MIRTIDPVYRPGVGSVFSVVMRLSDGRIVKWYEAEHRGQVTVAETRAATVALAVAPA